MSRAGDGEPATITRDGAPVGTVHLHPDSGHHRYEFTDPTQARDYLLFAEQMTPDALEPDDVLTDQLALAADLDRSPAVVFVDDEDDFFATGRHRTYGPGVGLRDVVARLTGPHRPGGEVVPLVWLPGRGFTPVTRVEHDSAA